MRACAFVLGLRRPFSTYGQLPCDCQAHRLAGHTPHAGLPPDQRSPEPDSLANCELGIRRAHALLHVPRLIDAADIASKCRLLSPVARRRVRHSCTRRRARAAACAKWDYTCELLYAKWD